MITIALEMTLRRCVMVNVFFGVITLSLHGCFEDLDPPSPCYNLDEAEVPQTLPDNPSPGMTLAEYQFLSLRDQALHCEVPIASGDDVAACQSFYVEKLGLTLLSDIQRHTQFPGLVCVDFVQIEGESYGYCDDQPSKVSGRCACLFDRDCDSGRCFASSLHDFECDQPDCTRCFTADEAPPLRSF